MKTSYGWRKVLARGRAVGSPHSDPEGHAREDPTGALSAERQSGAGTEIRLQAALVRAGKVAPTTTPRCPALQGEDVRFVPDSPVEEDGFEPSVPPAKKDPPRRDVRPFQHFPSERDRGFESVFLQRGVKNELLIDAAPLAVSSPNGRLSKGRVPRDIGDYMAFREIYLLIAAASGGAV